MNDILAFRGPYRTGDGKVTVAATQHMQAADPGGYYGTPLGRALAKMLRGWAEYATAHTKAYGSGIGEDGVLGTEWEAIGRSLIGLLNGETGGLDCGSLDHNIRAQLRAEGFSGE